LSNSVAGVRVAIAMSSILSALPIGHVGAESAPPPFTAKQCDQIRSSILGVFQRYDGKLSAELIADLREFSRKECDRTVKLRMMKGTADREAVGELKVLIAAQQ
jgi:hypothetical protein